MAWTELDLSAAVWVIEETSARYFYIPGLDLADDVAYDFQVDFDTAVSVSAGSSFLGAESLRTDDDPDLSARYWLGSFEDLSSPPQGVLTVGPGSQDWEWARADGETHVLFMVHNVPDEMPITGLRYQPSGGPPLVGTDTTDLSAGYQYTGYGDVADDLIVTPPPARLKDRLAPIRRVHQSLPAPTLVDGRPTW